METKGAVLVTGGAIRVGRAISLALADSGYDIALHYNASEKEAEATKAEIQTMGRHCTLFPADLNDSGEYTRLIEEAFSHFPALNVLVNNASIFERVSFRETDEEMFDRHMTINFKAPFFLSQAFAEVVKEGQIVNLLDTYITRETGSYFAYLLSKKALYHFTRMAAKDLGPGIRVNGIAIGTTDISRNLTEEELQQKEKRLPLGNIVTLEQVTHTLLDIIRNEYITGQCIFIDGGDELL